MEPPPLPGSGAASSGASSTLMPPPPSVPSGFAKASAHPSLGSNRDASGGLPPVPKTTNTGSSSPTSASTTGPMKPVNGTNAAAGPSKPVNRPASSKNAIVYNAVQRRNPVLQSIKNVGIEVGDIVADYQVGTHNGVLFLSLKYHRLHPEYIHQRIEKMRGHYNFRAMIVLCDVNEHQSSLRELMKIAIVNHFTTFVAWSNEEVAQYLTTLKSYEHKGGDSLKERIHQSYREQLHHVLTSGKKVNKADSDNLASQFGTFANISKQPSKMLAGVKGLAAVKVNSLVDAFTKPFLVGGLKRKEEDGETNLASAAGPNGAGEPIQSAINGPKRSGGTRSPETGRVEVGPGEHDPEMEPEVPEDIGSPDWPSDAGSEETDERNGAEAFRPPTRGLTPDRSPALSPEAGPPSEEPDLPSGEVWRDPLEDDDDDEGRETSPAGRPGTDAQEPSAKRTKLGMS